MSNQSIEETAQYIAYLNTVSNRIFFYVLVTTIPIGLIGNLVSFYIYKRPNLNKKTNTGFLYSYSCIFNLIFVLYYGLVFRSNRLFNYSLNIPCGINLFLFRFTWCIVPWMQVWISFDRFMVVIFPLKNSLMSKKWFMYSIMIGMIVFVILTNMSNLFTIESAVPWSSKPFVFCNMTIEASVASILSLVIIRTYLPFIFMLTLNIIVYIRLKKNKLKVGVSPHNAHNTHNARSPVLPLQVSHTSENGLHINGIHHLSNKQTKFIVSTLFIDLTFIGFYTPLAVFFSISLASILNMDMVWDPLSTAYINLFSNVTQLFAYTYSVSLIFIFVSFNRYFRKEILLILLRFHRIPLFRFLFPHIVDTNPTNTRSLN